MTASTSRNKTVKDKIKQKSVKLGRDVSEFNRKPPKWAYWMFGIGIIVLANLIGALM